MEHTLKQRRRSENYTSEETLRLLECVRKYQHIVANKATDGFTWRQKDEAWERISEEYNTYNRNTRTTKMLRCKFETLKKEARKYAAAQKESRLRTGGNVPTKIKSNMILDIVQKIISLECPPIVFDIDKMSEAVTTEAENNANKVNEVKYEVAEVIPELLHSEEEVPVISESLHNCICELQEQPLQQSPSAVEVESSSGIGVCTQCNQSQHTKTSSNVDQNLSSCITEKSSVATVQQQLLREQFLQREKRMQEIHEYNIQIKKTELAIKKAELINRRLDLKIKRKKLEDT